MARSALAGLGLLLLPLGLFAQQDPSFREAGVCSRCHVAQVLEWSASKHSKVKTTCQVCHGTSAGHVANERNQVKPDRLPQGDEAIGALCSTCHTPGCPKTQKKVGCQSCHHPHALANPNDTQLRQTKLPEDPNLPAYRTAMAEGENRTAQADWKGARDFFARAAELMPASRRAAARLKMAERRLNPQQPGFEIVGDAFDPESGLPLEVRVAGFGIQMRLVPGGDSDIGSSKFVNAKPVHSVRLEPFYLATHELTQRQWNALGGVENPSTHKGDDLPVHGVSWQDAKAWIAKLNARVPGGGFRLPSEAEWERAAGRHGPVTEEAWGRENSAIAASAQSTFREWNAYAPHAVGMKKPNAGGFFDMLGNVAEWCQSLYRPYPYSAKDGRESDEGDGLRTVRGGNYGDSLSDLDASFRHAERPGRRNAWTGLRLAR